MKTPTLVLAIILAMAVAGDSANIERLLRQLRLLAGEETIDADSKTPTKGATVDSKETKLLDLVEKLGLESEKSEFIEGDGEGDVDQNYEMAETGDQDPTAKEVGGEQALDAEQNYGMTGLKGQDLTPKEEGSAVIEQNYGEPETGEEDATSKEYGGKEGPHVEQTYDMKGLENQDPTSEEDGGEKGPDVEQNYGMAGLRDQDSTSEGSTSINPPGYTERGGSCYKVFGYQVNYTSAQRTCEADGGHLAIVNTEALNNFIVGLISARTDTAGDYWIGLNDQDTEGTYMWADGTILEGLAFANWAPNEPNNGEFEGQTQNCVHMWRYHNYNWDDDFCTDQKYFICQRGPGEDANCNEGVNVALGKTAYQTSIYVDGGAASLAVDGNTDGEYKAGSSCTHTTGYPGEADPTWWVDLGQSYMVGSVVIFNRMDCCSGRLNPFNIHIGDSDQITANPKCGGDHNIDVNQPSITVSCQGMKGRYVGVRLPGPSRMLTLCEVQVFRGR